MPQVKVKQEISGKKNDVYQAVKLYLEERGTLTKLGANVEWDDLACKASIKAGNFGGRLFVHEHEGVSHIEIDIDLPMLLTPFKGKVEEELKKHLGRVKV